MDLCSRLTFPDVNLGDLAQQDNASPDPITDGGLDAPLAFLKRTVGIEFGIKRAFRNFIFSIPRLFVSGFMP